MSYHIPHVSDEEIMQRRQHALEFFSSIPTNDVNLYKFYTHISNADSINKMLATSCDTRGCGIVACLAGWLWLMPAYVTWCMQHREAFLYNNNDAMDYSYIFHIGPLCCWLGASNASMFSERQPIDIGTDKEIAIQRLTTLLHAPITQYMP